MRNLMRNPMPARSFRQAPSRAKLTRRRRGSSRSPVSRDGIPGDAAACRRSLFAGSLPAGYHLRLLPLAGRRTLGMAALVVLQLRLGLVGFALPFRSGIALAGGRFLHAHDSLLVP